MKHAEDKQYYSQRKSGGNLDVTLDLLKQILLDYYTELDRRGYLDEWLGESDEWGNRYGGATSNPNSYVLRKLRKDMWPIDANIQNYNEDDLLTIIEFLHDHISKPGKKITDAYDSDKAQQEYRDELNPILKDFGTGLQLNQRGELRTTELAGMDYLLQANIPRPSTVNGSIIETIEKCIDKFRTRASSIDDRKAVILELAGVFEELQKQELLSQVLNNKDESAIFEFANNYAIRHRNPSQVTNYDRDIWLSWAFYYYLATIHAVLRLIQRQESITDKSQDLWLQALNELKRQNTSVHAIMRLAVPEINKGVLTLRFAFPFHSKRADTEPIKTLLLNTVRSVYGNQTQIDIKLLEKK